MHAAYTLDERGRLHAGNRILDAARWSWSTAAEPANSAQTFDDPQQAMAALRERAGLRRLAIGVIGPREATDAQREDAFAVGRALADLGLTLICGGRGGVMEAAAEGCATGGGLSIGILPGSSPDEANPHIAIPLPTGFGEGRNMIIAKAARALIAVGGSYGTLSEIAYGLHFGKPVYTLSGAPSIDGVHPVAGPDEAIAALCRSLLAPPASA